MQPMIPPLIPIDRFSIFASGLDHPECCAFDSAGNLWAGGEAGQVYRIDPAGKVETICSLGTFNAGVAFSAEDEPYICNPALGVMKLTPDIQTQIFAYHVQGQKIQCANFALFDPKGNLYLTDSGQWNKQNGFLQRFKPNGDGEILAGPLGYANGLALSADGSTLYMVESNTDRVLKFSISQNGAISDAKIFAENIGRMPDGLSLDAAGNLYVACYASDEIWRITPSGDRTLLAWDHYSNLVSRPTNLSLDGDNI